ncbi:aldose 1-epimerase family protein [Nocardioides iriomotensis]|uniref:Aldose epimerase n=1 Tax=Nocardioides iriomotensis TaxID=715784 RepID=A0A4V1Z1J9_9ACTN|nr:aldose 1-epimerase family protein [Nocardioides iriomotensis]RYU11166.1 aldose epimerase [Nocardioides iriomotensis]
MADVFPSGDQHEISAAGYRAVVTECGAGLRELSHDGHPLLVGFAEDEQCSWGRGQLLLPWPNRIRDGRYAFDGAEHQLPLTEVARGHASHGLTRWESWTLRERAAGSVTLGYRLMSRGGYPWTLDLMAAYSLSEAGLAVAVTAVNHGTTPAPYAAGAHPYFTAGPGDLDTWELWLPGATALVTDERLIPTGEVEVAGTDLDFGTGRVIGEQALDTAFGGLTRDDDGWAEVRLRGDREVVLRMDGHHKWVQAFTGPPGRRDGLALEPMTSPPNAFASGDDLLVLQPGVPLTVRWTVGIG